jgi:hypothetical protein
MTSFDVAWSKGEEGLGGRDGGALHQVKKYTISIYENDVYEVCY